MTQGPPTYEELFAKIEALQIENAKLRSGEDYYPADDDEAEEDADDATWTCPVCGGVELDVAYKENLAHLEACIDASVDTHRRAASDLRRELDAMQARLSRVQSEHTSLQDRHRHLESAHYKLSTDLSAMNNPAKREEREAKLLIQLGTLQEQLFQEQARNRELNHQCEQYRGRTPAMAAQQHEAGLRMLATLESTQRAYGVAYGERHARSLPASTQETIAKREDELVAKTQAQLDRERYEMLIGAVKSTRATTVGGLKTKILGLLSDMVDDLAEGDDDE